MSRACAPYVPDSWRCFAASATLFRCGSTSESAAVGHPKPILWFESPGTAQSSSGSLRRELCGRHRPCSHSKLLWAMPSGCVRSRDEWLVTTQAWRFMLTPLNTHRMAAQKPSWLDDLLTASVGQEDGKWLCPIVISAVFYRTSRP